MVKQSSIQYSLQDCVFIKIKVRGSLSRACLGLEYLCSHQQRDREIPKPNIFTHLNHYTSKQSFNCAQMLFVSIVFLVKFLSQFALKRNHTFYSNRKLPIHPLMTFKSKAFQHGISSMCINSLPYMVPVCLRA